MPSATILDYTQAIGRFGVAYVTKVCAHAHIGFDHTSADEDALAVDGAINYPEAALRVQVKATTKYSLSKQTGELTFPIEDAWREKWRINVNPTYLILVLLDGDKVNWLNFEDNRTVAGAYALWSRIDTLPEDATSVTMDRSRRFTTKTVSAWHEDLLSAYRPGGGPDD